jgi:hypothetical protein
MKAPKKHKVSRASLLAKVTAMVTGKKSTKRRPKARHTSASRKAFALAARHPVSPAVAGLDCQATEAQGPARAAVRAPAAPVPDLERTRGATGWSQGEIKAKVGQLMLLQANGRALAPLGGRPQVICRRFSHTETDPTSDWGKIPVDKLCVPTKRKKTSKRSVPGLGYLVNDKGSVIELHQIWEPAPPGEGCVIIELRTGARQ